MKLKWGRLLPSVRSYCTAGEIYSGFKGRVWVLRLFGCSQQEVVATCLLSVLLQPSCGPTLVDFLEITWLPHWGWLRRGSASAGLCNGQHRPPPLSPAALKKKVGEVFVHTKLIQKHNNLKINQILPCRYHLANRHMNGNVYFSPLQNSEEKSMPIESNLFSTQISVFCIHT